MGKKESMGDQKKIFVMTVVIAVGLCINVVATTILLLQDLGQTPTAKTCTTFNNRIQEQCIEDYIGLAKDDAVTRAELVWLRPQIASTAGS